MTSAVATMTLSEILDAIEASYQSVQYAADQGKLKAGETEYTILRGEKAIESAMRGKGKGNGLGKSTQMDLVVYALEELDSAAAILIPTTDNGLDDTGFRSATTFASQFQTRAGRLALAGKIKTQKKASGMKYTAELRIAPADLVEKLGTAPSSENVAAAKALILSYSKYADAKAFNGVDGDMSDAALRYVGQAAGGDHVAAIETALEVRDRHNAHIRLKILQGTVACRWY